MAAAVVLRADAQARESDLREFAAARLSDFEVPSRVWAVSEIPKGPAGKVQRNGLSDRLGAQSKPQGVAPTTHTERTIAAIWARELGREEVGIHDNFFALGGDSLSAARVVIEIRRALGRFLPLSTFLLAPTVSQMAGVVRRAYRPPVCPGRIVLYLAKDAGWTYRYDTVWGWTHLAGGGLEIEEVPGDHRSIVFAPSLLAEKLRGRIDNALERGPRSS